MMQNYLSDKGYDKSYGARPLQRLIQKEIKEPLAEEILFGKLKNGGVVNIILKDKKINFRLRPSFYKVSTLFLIF